MRKTRKLLERRRHEGGRAPGGIHGGDMLRARAFRPTPSMLVASCALIVALGGVAAAAIPHSTTGIITACYGPVGGLRVIDAQAGAACAPAEKQLTWNQAGAGGGAGMHAHVRADGTLDVARSSPGITMTRVGHGQNFPPFPVYCFTLPSQPDNVVASLEKTTTETDPMLPPGSVSFAHHALNGSVDPAVTVTAWGCPTATRAAVLLSERPNGAFYAQFG